MTHPDLDEAELPRPKITQCEQGFRNWLKLGFKFPSVILINVSSFKV